MTPEELGVLADQSSVGLALVAFCSLFAFDKASRTNKAFPGLLAKAAAVAAVPQALLMIYGAFKPEIIAKASGLRIAIAFGGLSLLWIALKAFVSDDDPNQIKSSASNTEDILAKGNIRHIDRSQ
jgi:hypothetical protein